MFRFETTPRPSGESDRPRLLVADRLLIPRLRELQKSICPCAKWAREDFFDVPTVPPKVVRSIVEAKSSAPSAGPRRGSPRPRRPDTPPEPAPNFPRRTTIARRRAPNTRRLANLAPPWILKCSFFTQFPARQTKHSSLIHVRFNDLHLDGTCG